jgi:hypothetical protein
VDSSGLNLEFGLGGMSVNMESLQSVIGGSVQLFTPGEYSPPAEAGREFELELEADPSYYNWAPYIEFEAYQSMYDAPLAQGIPVPTQATVTWKYRRALGALSDGEASAQGLVLLTQSGVMGTESLLKPRHKTARDVVLNFAGRSVPLDESTLVWQGGGLGLCVVDGLHAAWSGEDFRHPPEPESCTVYGPGGLHKVLNKEYLESREGAWQVTRPSDFSAGWNGAVVVASKDGRVIGLLTVDTSNKATVLPVPEDAPWLPE